MQFDHSMQTISGNFTPNAESTDEESKDEGEENLRACPRRDRRFAEMVSVKFFLWFLCYAIEV